MIFKSQVGFSVDYSIDAPSILAYFNKQTEAMQDITSFAELPKTSTLIQLKKNSCNDDIAFELDTFQILKSIELADEVGMNVQTIRISNCNCLERLSVGEWALNGSPSTFVVDHCLLLKEIVISNNSVMYCSLCALEGRNERQLIEEIFPN